HHVIFADFTADRIVLCKKQQQRQTKWQHRQPELQPFRGNPRYAREPGPAGPTGVAGLPGPRGCTGNKGDVGKAGSQGVPGPKGTPGTLAACSAGATDIRSLHNSLEWSEAKGEGKARLGELGRNRTWEGRGRGKLGRDRKWEEGEENGTRREMGREGEENWDETGSAKEKARGIGTRQEVGKRRRGELGETKSIMLSLLILPLITLCYAGNSSSGKQSGNTGSQSCSLSAGIPGMPGSPGPAGPTGVAGLPGPRGCTGNKGDVGKAGSQGAPGPQELQGHWQVTGNSAFSKT
ncbi:hypothetical protein OS493_009889, partial [Desmophyllum pertusum]